MSFTHRLSAIDLISPALTGMSAPRKMLWRKTLDECKQDFEKRGLSASINSTASASIDALREKSTSNSEGLAALGIYRYVGEGLTRSVLSMAYEDKLPFDWSCNWSAASLQEVMVRISSFLAPMTLQRRSKLLLSFPVSVLGSIMDAITSSGAHELGWWSDPENFFSVIRKAKNMAKGFSGQTVPEQEKRIIKVAVLIFVEGVQLLGSITGAKDFASLHKVGVLRMQQLMKRRYDDDRNSEVVPPFLFTKQKVLHIWHLLLELDVTFGFEMGILIDVQMAYLNVKQHSLLTNICRNIVTKEGENESVVQLMSLDIFLMDMAYLYSDMFRTIELLRAEDQKNEVGHIMTVLAEPWQENRRCNHRKLFMLCVALTEGIKPETIDNSLLVNAIMEKLDDTGKFSSLRKRRAKLTSRKGKRAPKLQPRVIYSRPLSDSEDEYTSRHNSRKRAESMGRKGSSNNMRNRTSDSDSESERRSPSNSRQKGNSATQNPVSTPATPITSAPQRTTRTLLLKKTAILSLRDSSSLSSQSQPSPTNPSPRIVPQSSTYQAPVASTSYPSEENAPSKPPPTTSADNGSSLMEEMGLEMSINEDTSPLRVKKKRKQVKMISAARESNVVEADSTEKETAHVLPRKKLRRSARTRMASKR